MQPGIWLAKPRRGGKKNRRLKRRFVINIEGLNRHWRFNSRMRVITFYFEVFKAVVED